MAGVPEKEIIEFIGELFKGFADPTRVHILSMLAEKELCVTEICDAVDVSQSAVSHQLALMKQMHLVTSRREGKNILIECDGKRYQRIPIKTKLITKEDSIDEVAKT